MKSFKVVIITLKWPIQSYFGLSEIEKQSNYKYNMCFSLFAQSIIFFSIDIRIKGDNNVVTML